jgi:hypothetical protein
MQRRETTVKEKRHPKDEYAGGMNDNCLMIEIPAYILGS